MLDPIQTDTCIFCGDERLIREKALVAGSRWPVCKMCAGAGRTLMDEGWLQPALHCLHLTAMEIERFAEDYAAGMIGPTRRWLASIRVRFAKGDFRKRCACDGCNGRPVAGAIADLHDEFGVVRETFADTMPLNVLQSMRPGQLAPASDGSIWKAVDEIARRTLANMRETQRDPRAGLLSSVATPRVLPDLRNWDPVLPVRWKQ